MRSPALQRDFVRVSEISEYLFCRRNWYLTAQGVRPSAIQTDKMRAGIARRRRHGLLVAFSQRLMIAAVYFLIFALAVVAGYWFWTDAR
jgi:CRISPR/Cas system-associated exonuclease Cas4 (RecB family)